MLGWAFETLEHTFQTLGRAFQATIENLKLGGVFPIGTAHAVPIGHGTLQF